MYKWRYVQDILLGQKVEMRCPSTTHTYTITMAAVAAVERGKNAKGNRRRKKRRTEDFSSDESSSSSSSSSSDEENEEEPENPNLKATAVTIDDIDINSDAEDVPSKNEALPADLQKRIDTIKFAPGIEPNSKNTNQIKETVRKDKAQLESEYLGLMAANFGDDLDQLRKRPDFTDKSLVLLAKVLQSGSNMFDAETLDAVLKG